MYLKQVVIKNFKSYREKTILDNIDRNHNIFIGRNGSGKSNLFSAIEFVLSSNTRLLEHQKLAFFHCGRGPFFYVEVLLAECDILAEGQSDEIRIRRVLREKRSTYFINKKKTNPKEVMILLELLGFSLPQACNIFQQNLVTRKFTQGISLKYIINSLGAIFSQNLDFLREIMRSLQELKDKIETLNEMNEQINEDFLNLKQERIKVKKLQKLRSFKMMLLVIIREKHIEDSKKKLDKILSSAGINNQTTDLCQSLNMVKMKIIDKKQLITQLQLKRDHHESITEDMVKEIDSTLKKKDKLEMKFDDVQSTINQLKNIFKETYGTYDLEERTISQKESELRDQIGGVEQLYLTQKKKVEEMEHELRSKLQKREDIISLQAKCELFDSKKERDNWIIEKLRTLRKQIQDANEKKNTLTESKVALEILKDEQEKELKELQDESAIEDKCREETISAKANLIMLQDELNDIRRKDFGLQNTLLHLNKSIKQKIFQLRLKHGNGIINGIESVKKVLNCWKNKGSSYFSQLCSGYLGTLNTNFSLSKSLSVAVEVTAGKRLLSHIVQYDSVGTEILKEMKRQNLPGEVWFMPLNRIQTSSLPALLPELLDAKPLIQLLEFSDIVKPAMEYVFGKVLICRTIEVAVDLSRQYNLNCVTLTGEKVNYNGTMSGGYINQNMASVETSLDLAKLESEEITILSALEDLKNKKVMLESKIDETLSTLTKLRVSEKFQQIRTKRQLLQERLSDIQAEINSLNSGIIKADLCLKKLLSSEEVLQSKFDQDFTRDEPLVLSELETIKEDMIDLKKNIEKEKISLYELEQRKFSLEMEYKNCKSHEDIKLSDIKDIAKLSALKDKYIIELSQINNRLKWLERKLENSKEEITRATDLEKESSEELCTLADEKQKLIENAIKLDKERIKGEIIFYENKISGHTNQLAKLKQSFKTSKEQMEPYKDYNISQLMKELTNIKEKIKQFEEVNEKDFRYLNTTSLTLKSCLTEKREIIEKEFCIGFDFLTSFEDWMQQHIVGRLRQISDSFSKIFRSLVPNSSAKLIIEEKGYSNWEDYIVGSLSKVCISVEFENQMEVQDLNLLSGGERTFIILALLGAFIHNFPSCFYIFDEVDRALDHDHRMILAKLMSKVENVQFFTSSHFPEVLSIGDQFFSIRFENMASQIFSISKADAYEEINKFLTGDTSDYSTSGSFSFSSTIDH